MARSAARTVDAYLAELPEKRRAVVAAVRDLVLRHLPDGYEETMNWGMISYEIPLSRYPDTYNGQPLAVAALAAQKNYYSLYLTCAHGDEERLREGFARAGKTLDMGKSCVRFRALEDLALEPVAQVLAAIPPEAFIARYERARTRG